MRGEIGNWDKGQDACSTFSGGKVFARSGISRGAATSQPKDKKFYALSLLTANGATVKNSGPFWCSL